MRNKFAQKCYVCGKLVEVGQGHFQRHNGKWLAKHAGCKPQYANDKLIINRLT